MMYSESFCTTERSDRSEPKGSTMLATSTYLDLIRAINLNPDEDTPRLGLADYIDEIAEGEPDRARARLIRAQCALAHLPEPELKTIGRIFGVDNDKRYFRRDGQEYGLCPLCTREEHCTYHTLRHKELDAIACYDIMWRSPPCPKCKGPGGKKSRSKATWFPCKHCKGKGSVGALSERVIRVEGVGEKTKGTPDYKYPLAWVRGFPQVRVPIRDIGQFTNTNKWEFALEWLARALRAVREEGASFKMWGRTQPYWHGKAYCWYDIDRSMRSGGVPPTAELPTRIFNKLKQKGGRLAEYKTPPEAHADLNYAVTRLVVEETYPQVKEIEETQQKK